MDITLRVPPSNGALTRTIAAKTDTVELFDHFNPYDAFRRGKFLDTLAAKLQVSRGELNGLDDEIVREANRADEHPSGGDTIVYRQFTCAELNSGDFEEEFLIENVLVAGQPLVVSGPRKGLKTSLLVDLALSLATGTPFLGKFRVTRSVRVALMSGESGLSTLQKTARAVAAQKDKNLDDVDALIWSPDLPKFGHLLHMDAMRRFLKENAADLCVLDPAYLCLVDDKPGELSARGAVLREIVEVCNDVHCMLGIAHHYNRIGAMSFEEPSLDWISGSAFAEFMRQWILTGRRSKYVEGSGVHELWLSLGGSSGHSSLWGLNIFEGVFPDRRWEPELMRPDEIRDSIHEAKTTAKQAEQQEEMEKDKNAILRTLAQAAGKLLCKTEIQDRHRRNKQKFNAAFAELADEGSIVAEQFRNTQNKLVNGWRIKPDDLD